MFGSPESALRLNGASFRLVSVAIGVFMFTPHSATTTTLRWKRRREIYRSACRGCNRLLLIGLIAHTSPMACLQGDAPLKRQLAFSKMCRGWALGCMSFKQDLIEKHLPIGVAGQTTKHGGSPGCESQRGGFCAERGEKQKQYRCLQKISA